MISGLRERIQAFIDFGDANAVLGDVALGEAQRLAATLMLRPEDYSRSDVEVLNVLGWLYWCRQDASPSGGDADTKISLGLFAIVIVASPDVAIPDQMRQRLVREPTASRGTLLAQLDVSITALFPSLEAASNHQPVHTLLAVNLFELLLRHYSLTRQPQMLDLAIGVGELLVDTGSGSPMLAIFLSDLAAAFHARFRLNGSPRDLSASIELLRRVLYGSSASDPARDTVLANLAVVLRDLYESTGEPSALDRSIDWLRETLNVALPSDPGEDIVLATLSDALRHRYNLTGSLLDRDSAKALRQQSIEVTLRKSQGDDWLPHRGYVYVGEYDRHMYDSLPMDRYYSLRSPRVINSLICAAGTTLGVPKDVPLTADADYDILVDIGRSDERSLLGGALFPDQHLPGGGLWLTVVGYAPEFWDSPQARTIFLPEDGNSFACPCTPNTTGSPHTCQPDEREPYARLNFTTPDLPGEVTVRMAIYCRAAVVHVHELVLAIAEGPGLRGRLIYTLTRDFTELQAFATRTLSVMTAEAEGSSTPQVYINGVSIPPLAYSYNDDQAEEISQQARRVLFGIHLTADAPHQSLFNEKLGKGPDAFKADLLELAKVGQSIYASFFLNAPQQIGQMLRHEAAAASVTVQIARPSTQRLAIPWQLVYDLPMQSDGDVHCCPSLEDFGPATSETRSIPRLCPHLADHPPGKSILCLFGFWGLAHILEVPPHIGDKPNLPRVVYDSDAPLTTLVAWNSHLNPQAGASRAEPGDLTESQRHLRTLREGPFGVLTPELQTKDEFATALGPSIIDLVYLYCHEDRYTPLGAKVPNPRLDLGADQRFTPQDVSGWSELYSWPDPHWPDRHPLVIINACHSGAMVAATLADFVGAFAQTAGAAGVIATEVALEQKVAGLAMETFLAELAAPGVSCGEAIRRMRWQLIKRGNVMGLAYSPYCAADLKLRPDPVT